MSVIVVFIFLAIIMGFGIRRNRKTSVISELPLSKLDENKLVLK